MTRRRIYLMRHAQVSYFEDGRPVRPDLVVLTEEGRSQARAAAALLDGIAFDRVITSGLPRTLETARIVAPADRSRSPGPSCARSSPAGSPTSRRTSSRRCSSRAGVTSSPRRRSSSAARRSPSCSTASSLPSTGSWPTPSWDVVLLVLHGGVNRAILSYALTGGRAFLGNFEQSPACVNVLDVGEDWVVRAVNHAPTDPAHLRGRLRTMEELWQEFRATD